MDFLLVSDFKKACHTMATYESNQIKPRGFGINWKNYDSTRDEKVLELIYKKIDETEEVKTIASLIHLFGNSNQSFFRRNEVFFKKDSFKLAHNLLLDVLRENNTRDYLESAKDEKSIVIGVEFFATLQLRTPLKVLLKHGTLHTDKNSLPKFTDEVWMGMWFPKLKSAKELGLKIPDMPESTAGSDIGYVYPSKFIKFLISFREIVESDITIKNKIEKINALQHKSEEFKEFYLRFLQNDKDFPSSFFYKKLCVIPNLKILSARELFEKDIYTVEKLRDLTDDDLLKISGIGQQTIKSIREYLKKIK